MAETFKMRVYALFCTACKGTKKRYFTGFDQKGSPTWGLPEDIKSMDGFKAAKHYVDTKTAWDEEKKIQSTQAVPIAMKLHSVPCEVSLDVVKACC